MFDIFYGNSYKLIFLADYYRLEKLFALSYKPFECVIIRNLIIILLRVCQTNGNSVADKQ